MELRKPLVDLNTNTVSWGGKTTKLDPTKTEILALLVRRAPGLVSHDTLISNVWGDNEPDNANDSLKVHVCNMRRRFEASGIALRIQNVWGSGYTVEFDR